MSKAMAIILNGRKTMVSEGTTVAAALMMADQPSRISVTGAPRAPLCGMGVCMECRATVDGVARQQTCQLPCREAMEVVTG